MMIAEFDWDEFSALPVLPPPNEITFLPFSIGSHLICGPYGNVKRDESLSLPSDDLLKEIAANRIDLQFCLLQSICGQSAANIYIDSRISKSDLFRTVLPFSYCYHFVQFEQRNGILYGIAASGLNPNAREIFISLFKLRQLNPFVSFCADGILCADQINITGDLSLYEIKGSKGNGQMSGYREFHGFSGRPKAEIQRCGHSPALRLFSKRVIAKRSDYFSAQQIQQSILCGRNGNKAVARILFFVAKSLRESIAACNSCAAVLYLMKMENRRNAGKKEVAVFRAFGRESMPSAESMLLVGVR